jgi:cellulose synthase (UDP-forming)
LVLVWLAYLIRADGFFRPKDAKVLGWEKALFAALQWPWVLWGCTMATWDKLSGKFVDVRVTPKGEAASSVVSWSVLLPYFALALGSLAPVLLINDVQAAAGFYIFALINATIYTSLFAVIIINHLRENPSRHYQLSKHALAQFVSVALLGGAIGYGAATQGRDAAIALATTTGDLQFLQSGYVVAGAGQGNYGNLHVTYNSNWLSELLQTRIKGGE